MIKLVWRLYYVFIIVIGVTLACKKRKNLEDKLKDDGFHRKTVGRFKSFISFILFSLV